MRQLSCGLAIAVLTLSLAVAASPPTTPPAPAWRSVAEEGQRAMRAKDYGKLADVLVRLKPLMPGNARNAYNLAATQAHLGDRRAALDGLRQLGRMGVRYDLDADADFAALRSDAEYLAVKTRMAENAKPVTHSQQSFELGEKDLIPEDIAHDAKSGRFFIGSVRQAKIITADGKLFATTDLPVFALRIDETRRILWAATGWVPQCARCDPAGKDKSALLAFDLDSGRQTRRIESPVKGVLGDMTIGKRGDLYVADGVQGALFRLKAGEQKLERLDSPGELPSPQTPCLSYDETVLYIPDYVRGIAEMTLATRAVRWLVPAADIAINGIDGLYCRAHSFIAVQNGTRPPRIVRLSRDLQKQEVLESGWPGLGEPTHGTVVGDHFYFLTNTGWDAYDDNGQRQPGAASVTSTVRERALDD